MLLWLFPFRATAQGEICGRAAPPGGGPAAGRCATNEERPENITLKEIKKMKIAPILPRNIDSI